MLDLILTGAGLGLILYGYSSQKKPAAQPAVVPPPRVAPIAPAPAVQPPEDPDAPVNPPTRPTPGFLEPEVVVRPDPVAPPLAQAQDMPNEAPGMAEPAGQEVEEDDPSLLSQVTDWWNSEE